jgi:hypothetical protein
VRRSSQAHPSVSSPVVLYLYVDHVDAAVADGVSAGATLLMPVEDRLDRSDGIEETTAGERERRWSNFIS